MKVMQRWKCRLRSFERINGPFNVKAILLAACVIALFAPLLASAIPNTPNKAKKFQADLVTAYEECPGATVMAPNTTDEDGIPGCTPPVRTDSVCGFGAKGKGQVVIKVVGNKNVNTSGHAKDISLQAKLSGLDSGCEGEALGLSLFFRMTGDGCDSPSAGTPCTIIDFPLLLTDPLNVVVKGKWKLKTRLNDAWEPILGAASQHFPTINDNGFILVDVAVIRAGNRTFETGLALR